MKILLTGCAGFIGSHLCEKLLAEGHQITGIDNFDSFYSRDLKESNMSQFASSTQFKFREIDIRSKESLFSISEEFELIVHLAAKAGVRPSIENPQDYIETNIMGTQNLLNLMLERKVDKMIFASSSSVYGDKTPAPYVESAMVDFPISPYAFTKKSCELMLYTYFHLYKINSILLRFFTVYGPRQRPDLAINKFFTSITEDKKITVFGDGTTSRDYTFIDDIIDGIMKSILLMNKSREINEIINLGNHKPTKLMSLIGTIEDVIGKKAKIIHEKMQPGDVLMTCADISKAQRLLNYTPKTTMKEGLEKYYQWRLLSTEQKRNLNQAIL